MRIPRSAHNREARVQALYYKFLLSFSALGDDERAVLARRAHDRKHQPAANPAPAEDLEDVDIDLDIDDDDDPPSKDEVGRGGDDDDGC